MSSPFPNPDLKALLQRNSELREAVSEYAKLYQKAELSKGKLRSRIREASLDLAFAVAKSTVNAKKESSLPTLKPFKSAGEFSRWVAANRLRIAPLRGTQSDIDNNARWGKIWSRVASGGLVPIAFLSLMSIVVAPLNSLVLMAGITVELSAMIFVFTGIGAIVATSLGNEAKQKAHDLKPQESDGERAAQVKSLRRGAELLSAVEESISKSSIEETMEVFTNFSQLAASLGVATEVKEQISTEFGQVTDLEADLLVAEKNLHERFPVLSDGVTPAHLVSAAASLNPSTGMTPRTI